MKFLSSFAVLVALVVFIDANPFSRYHNKKRQSDGKQETDESMVSKTEVQGYLDQIVEVLEDIKRNMAKERDWKKEIAIYLEGKTSDDIKNFIDTHIKPWIETTKTLLGKLHDDMFDESKLTEDEKEMKEGIEKFLEQLPRLDLSGELVFIHECKESYDDANFNNFDGFEKGKEEAFKLIVGCANTGFVKATEYLTFGDATVNADLVAERLLNLEKTAKELRFLLRMVEKVQEVKDDSGENLNLNCEFRDKVYDQLGVPVDKSECENDDDEDKNGGDNEGGGDNAGAKRMNIARKTSNLRLNLARRLDGLKLKKEEMDLARMLAGLVNKNK